MANGLLGAVLVGDCDDYQTLLQYYLNALELPDEPESLIMPGGEAIAPLSAGSLPREATLCACHKVTKGEVLAALRDGCATLAAVQSTTRAGTGCGTCTGLIESLLPAQAGAAEGTPGHTYSAQLDGREASLRPRKKTQPETESAA